MLIDLHSHELRYSSDGQNLEDMVNKARVWIDALCVAGHDSEDWHRIGWESTHNGVRVFVGCEVHRHEGDILVFGAKSLPAKRVSLSTLYHIVQPQKGADRSTSVSAQ